MLRYQVVISGQVQGVGFRASCRRAAWQHGVAGWVRNLADGRVEAVFEGPAAQVERMLDWARRGPRLALVTDVAVQAQPAEGLGSFTIK